MGEVREVGGQWRVGGHSSREYGILASTWVCMCPLSTFSVGPGIPEFYAAPLKSSGLSVEILAAFKAVSSPQLAT